MPFQNILWDWSQNECFLGYCPHQGFWSFLRSNIGDPRATDRVIMNWASTNGYVVFTNDLDFGILLAATQAEAPSVIQVRTQPTKSFTSSEVRSHSARLLLSFPPPPTNRTLHFVTLVSSGKIRLFTATTKLLRHLASISH